MVIDILEKVENKLPGSTYLVAITTDLGTATCVFWADDEWKKTVFTVTDLECGFLGMNNRTEEPIYSDVKAKVHKHILDTKNGN